MQRVVVGDSGRFRAMARGIVLPEVRTVSGLAGRLVIPGVELWSDPDRVEIGDGALFVVDADGSRHQMAGLSLNPSPGSVIGCDLRALAWSQRRSVFPPWFIAVWRVEDGPDGYVLVLAEIDRE